MRALFKPSAAPGLEMIECAEPTPGPYDVKIRVEKTGICGTDLHIDSWDAWAASAVNAPLIIGHEFSGRIVEMGSEAEAQAAINGLNGQSVDGRQIVVNVSRPKEAGTGGGGYRSSGPRY